MKIETDIKEVDIGYNLSFEDLHEGIYLISEMPESRIIIWGDLRLYVEDGDVELLDDTAWTDNKFTFAPEGNKITISFIQD